MSSCTGWLSTSKLSSQAKISSDPQCSVVCFPTVIKSYLSKPSSLLPTLPSLQVVVISSCFESNCILLQLVLSLSTVALDPSSVGMSFQQIVLYPALSLKFRSPLSSLHSSSPNLAFSCSEALSLCGISGDKLEKTAKEVSDPNSLWLCPSCALFCSSTWHVGRTNFSVKTSISFNKFSLSERSLSFDIIGDGCVLTESLTSLHHWLWLGISCTVSWFDVEARSVATVLCMILATLSMFNPAKYSNAMQLTPV